RPTRQHIAYLGGILQDDVKHVERRAAFWAKATAKLDALGKRVSPEERRKLEAALEVRIPKPSTKRFGAITARSSAGRRGAEEVAALQGQIQALQIELENPSPSLALLRARRERPRRRRADEERDELAPPHSITSS